MSYLQSLKVIVTVYKKSLAEAAVKKETIDKIFSNIDSIYKINQKLVQHLEESQSIGAIFLTMVVLSIIWSKDPIFKNVSSLCE